MDKTRILIWIIWKVFRYAQSVVCDELHLNCSLCTGRVIKTHKSKAFALVGGSVNEDLATDNIAKGEEHLHQLCISKLLRKMINE